MEAAVALNTGRVEELLSEVHADLFEQTQTVPEPPPGEDATPATLELLKRAVAEIGVSAPPPPPPALAAPDPVPPTNVSDSADASAAAVPAPDDETGPVVFGLSSVTKHNAWNGLKAAGWTPRGYLIEPGESDAEIREHLREATAADPKVGLILTGEISRRRSILEGTTPAVVLLCASESELVAAGEVVVEKVLAQRPEPLVNPPMEMIDHLVTKGGPHRLGVADLTIGPDVDATVQQMFVVALTKPGVQGRSALILRGDEATALQVARKVQGWALIAINPTEALPASE